MMGQWEETDSFPTVLAIAPFAPAALAWFMLLDHAGHPHFPVSGPLHSLFFLPRTLSPQTSPLTHFRYCLSERIHGDGEMDSLVKSICRSCTGPGLIPSTHIGWLTAACHSSDRNLQSLQESSAVFLSFEKLYACGTHTCTNAHKHLFKNRITLAIRLDTIPHPSRADPP